MGKRREKRAVLMAGPTASGKSALALDLARQQGGVIVNADALQVYEVLQLLTARPSEIEMAGVPHRLYGVVHPSVRFSTGQWARAAAAVIEAEADRPLIFVGGTGLYFDVLTSGFADVPEVTAEAMAAAAAEVEGWIGKGVGGLSRRAILIAGRLSAPDPQRVIRALAVLNATGRSLASFQDAAQTGLLDGFVLERLVLNPDRELLRQRIARRFETMFSSGAVEEVEALLALQLDKSLPAMKAIGAPEITAMLAGELEQDTAIERAVVATRQYAKRQRTWFRNRMADWNWIVP